MSEVTLEEALIISPATPDREQRKGTKRKCTPSSESSSPSKSLILSPSGSLPDDRVIVRLNESPVFSSYAHHFPFNQVCIQSRSTIESPHAHPDHPSSYLTVTDGNAPTPPRHIILPFDLRHDPTAFDSENAEILFDLYPETKGLFFSDHFIIFWLGRLPPKPWPVTIAGLQPYFTLDANDQGPTPPIKRASQSILKIARDVDGKALSKEDPEEVFELAKNFFHNAEIPITEVQLWGNFLVIVLEDRKVDLKTVPSIIAQCPCYYLYEDEMDRPQTETFQAKRLRDPRDGVVDNSKYNVLRSGVMVSSGKSVDTHTEYLTSAGVLVQDELDNKYLTVASHGFPFGNHLFHPSASGTEIGKAIMEVGHTDIALVQLHENITFINESFESALDDAQAVSFRGLISPKKLIRGDKIYMNNPFTGYSEGTCGPTGFIRVPSDDPHVPKLDWVQTQWSYMGQGSITNLQDGVCGSAIWSGSGHVLGFFRYAPTSGPLRDWCMSVSADNLIKRGYRLAT